MNLYVTGSSEDLRIWFEKHKKCANYKLFSGMSVRDFLALADNDILARVPNRVEAMKLIGLRKSSYFLG